MIGLYLLFLLGIWTVLVAWLSVKIAKRLPVPKWRPLVGIGLFIILLPMVLIDEMVGKRQFERLCQENSTIYIAPDAKGRTVYLADTPVEVAKGTWVNIVLHPWRYVDAKTGETIVSYNILGAGGGWFMHHFYGGGGPILFNGYCAPPKELSINTFNTLGINYISSFGVGIAMEKSTANLLK